MKPKKTCDGVECKGAHGIRGCSSELPNFGNIISVGATVEKVNGRWTAVRNDGKPWHADRLHQQSR